MALLALLLCLGLTACGKNPSGNQETAWVGAARYQGAFSDQGYYYMKDGILSYLDISTGNTTVLCTKAGCPHKDEFCEAHTFSYLDYNAGGTCFWNGSLYFVELTSEATNLVRCNATGTDRTVMGTLGAKYTQDKKQITTQNFALSENFWYYHAEVKGSVWDEKAQRFTTKRVLDYIGRIDLRTGKEEILVEDQENTLALYAAKNDAAVFSTHGIPDVDISDRENYREQLYKLPFIFKRWDGQTGQISTLFEKGSNGSAGIQALTLRGVYKDKLYYSVSVDGNLNQYTYNLNTGEDALFAAQTNMFFWGGGYARCRDFVSGGDWYILELESGKKLPIDPEGNLLFECGSDRGCILQLSADPPDGGPKEHRVCYVPYTALTDGLQETDLTPVYTWRNSM